MSDEQVRDEAVTMFNAGHDSTAAALAWIWYLVENTPKSKRGSPPEPTMLSAIVPPPPMTCRIFVLRRQWSARPCG